MFIIKRKKSSIFNIYPLLKEFSEKYKVVIVSESFAKFISATKPLDSSLITYEFEITFKCYFDEDDIALIFALEKEVIQKIGI